MPSPSAVIAPSADSVAPVFTDDDPLGLNGPPIVAAPEPLVLPEDDEVVIYDGPLRYLVRSRKRPEIQHLVQLDAYNFNGSCGCEHFSIPLLNKLREGVPPSDDTRCYHIKRVRGHLLDWFVREVSMVRGDTTHDDLDGVG